MRNAPRKMTGKHYLGSVLFLVGFVLTIWLGVISGQQRQPSAATNTLLVVLSGIFQAAGATVFHKIGKADPGLVHASVRRLAHMANHASEAKVQAQDVLDKGGPPSEVRRTIGLLSTHFSYIEEDALETIDDWYLVNPTAAVEASRRGKNNA
ncbi:MAG TPA: hypothetical protein VGL93_11020 [Streptosporangiaceae bacterium]